ncbi:MAG TPA: hypothetical protein VJY62_00905 [Bacteroidia bacterium]|nr:hypothetical protein [Bacteroidia bacterium]
MKKIIFLFLLSSLNLVHQKSFSQITKNDIDSAFKKNEIKIAGEGRSCAIVNFLAGDLNRDSTQDVLVYYSCQIKETIGKSTTGGGWAIWLNKNGTLEFLLKDENKFGLSPKEIFSDGSVLCDQLGYDSDSSKPSVIGHRKVKLTDKGLVILK